MADEKLNWAFELFDRMSGPAKAMVDRMDALERRLSGTERAVDSFSRTTESASGGIIAMGAGLSGWIHTLSSAAGLLKSIGSTIFSWGKVAVDALAFRESTLSSFQMMLGTKKAADELFADATSMARTTPFDTKEVVTAYRTLLTAGFKKTEIPIVFQAVGDQAAAMGMKKEIIGQLAYVFGQIKSAGRIQGHNMMELTAAGVSRAGIIENLGKQLHLSSEAVKSGLANGSINADQSINAILQTIANKAGGGVIGGGMEKQSQTILGLWSNFESVLDDAFYAFDRMEDLPGLNALKGTIQNLITLFDLTTDSGKRFRDTLQGMFNDAFSGLFGGLSGPAGLERMRKGFIATLDVIKQVWEAIKGLGRGIEAFWKEFEPALASFGPAGGDADNLATTGERIGQAFEKAGGAVGRMSRGLIELFDRADRSQFINAMMYLTGAGASNGVALAGVGARAATAGEVGYDPSKDPEKGLGGYLASLFKGNPNPAALRPSIHVNVPLTVHGNPKPESVQKAVTQAVDTAATSLERLQLQRGGG